MTVPPGYVLYPSVHAPVEHDGAAHSLAYAHGCARRAHAQVNGLLEKSDLYEERFDMLFNLTRSRMAGAPIALCFQHHRLRQCHRLIIAPHPLPTSNSHASGFAHGGVTVCAAALSRG